jgi:HxlR-like helix-turn-helix
VATNLLAQRLRDLETGAVIERRLDRPGRRVVYALTGWGAGLRETVEALLCWSTPLMTPGPGSDAVQPHWLELALTALLADRTAVPAVEMALETAGAVLMVRVDQSGPAVTALAPPAELLSAMTVLRTEPPVALGLAAGTLTAEQAIAAADLTGDPGPLRQIFTRPAPR